MTDEAGQGMGWERLALKVRETVAPETIAGIWAFPVLRQDQREWGTAVLACVEGQDGERCRIYTARYMLQVKGKERGKFEASVEEVGSGPLDQLPALLQEVHHRTDDDEPPAEVDVASWFPAPADAPAR
ncbi:MAG TPA: hypothetical protein VF037_11120 [Gemmatimonadales bacterium]